MTRPDGSAKEIAIPLTGRFSFRRSWRGKLVLRVEENFISAWPWSRGERRQRWRDATLMDLAAPEMRALMDLRARPQYIAQRYFDGSEAGLMPGSRASALQEIEPAPVATTRPRAWEAFKNPQ